MNQTQKISQFELFSNAIEKQSGELVKKRPLLRDMTLTVENSIIAAVMILMAFVLFFSLGVERGKKISVSPKDASKIAVAQEKKADIMGSSVSAKHEKNIPVAQEEASYQEGIPQSPVLEHTAEPAPKKNDLIENFYTIQVASFKQKDSAEKEALKIKNNLGHETFVISKGDYVIVCVGRFEKKDDAQLVAHRLKSKYNDYYIRRL
ncbi:MAG TPA: SPOR domain-containing protein [Candidatus Omnitrophota bacterium]|nr:SPOR domain-containing protein [Candidatus Omnitrophota bacterium]